MDETYWGASGVRWAAAGGIFSTVFVAVAVVMLLARRLQKAQRTSSASTSELDVQALADAVGASLAHVPPAATPCLLPSAPPSSNTSSSTSAPMLVDTLGAASSTSEPSAVSEEYERVREPEPRQFSQLDQVRFVRPSECVDTSGPEPSASEEIASTDSPISDVASIRIHVGGDKVGGWVSE